MADTLCTSKPITKFPHFVPHYIPSKQFLPFLSPSFSHHSILSINSKNRRKKLNLSCLCTPNSPDFDVISTHEHSDGSLVFCFGEPSEVVKNDQLSETNVQCEERELDDNEFSNVVNVLDGDHKREVIVKKIDGKVKNIALIEVIDEANYIAVDVDDKVNSSNEKLSSSSVKDEILVSTLSIELVGNGASLETIEPVIDSNSLLDPVFEVIGDDVDEETTHENVEVENSSIKAEIENDVIETVALSLPLEVESILDEEINIDMIEKASELDNSEESLDVENGMENEINGENVVPLSLPLKVEPLLEEEPEIDTIGEASELDREADTTTIIKSSVIRSKAIVENDELVEASTSEVLELKSTEFPLQSEQIPMPELFFSSGASLLQHPQKALTGGEDAYFTFQNWLGVADGVAQWSLEGVNPGLYAKELMENCQKIMSDCNNVSITSPEQVLNLTVAETHSPGASTLLIAHCDGQALHVANIGDSGFITIRNGVLYQKSSPMLHEFNFPVHIERGDDPSKIIERYKIDLDEGDVIVIATDGLFDNLYEQEIISIVMKSLEDDKNPEEIAKILAMRAVETGSSKSTRTPFADAAQAAGYGGYTGGKVDDVAVIVSFVEKFSDSRAL